MTNRQMELSLTGDKRPWTVAQKQRRLERAGWWFKQMRLLVDCAFDWSGTPPARPEQTWLPTARHAARV